MKKSLKLLGLSLIVAMTLQVSFASVTLKDIDKHWAKEDILKMVEKKIILGYPDSTFKPDNKITKMEALILSSRVLGIDKDENQAILYHDTYESFVKNYPTYTQNALAYLIGKKIYTQDELKSYLGSNNGSDSLKRYEVAVVFTKVLGAENEVKSKSFVILPFSDSADIPSYAKSYVEYMNKKEVMKGITATKFEPLTDVTRAQACKMLLSVDNLLSNVKLTPTPTGLITITPIISVTPIIIPSSYVNGFVTQVSVDTKKITIKSGLTEGEIPTEYEVAQNVIIKRGLETVSLNQISINDNLKIGLLDKKIVTIDISISEESIAGTLDSVDISNVIKINVIKDNTKYSYDVLSSVLVYRDSSTITLKELNQGDKVTLTIVNNKVKLVRATSTKSIVEGIITEVKIASKPTFTVKSSSNETFTYSFLPNATVNVDGIAADFYALRLDYKVKVYLDSNTCYRLDATKEQESKEVKGTISLINTNIKVVTLQTEDNKELSVFLDNYVKINDALTGNSISLSELKQGYKVTCYGATVQGVYICKLIIISAK